MKEREANVRKAMEWRSLLPRMVYLSIQCASASFKENVEANGSLSKSEIPSELGFLLERYAKVLGYSLDDAIAMVATVSSGQKSFEVVKLPIVFQKSLCASNHILPPSFKGFPHFLFLMFHNVSPFIKSEESIV